jgi:tetratricopeptide (TPR) repeat protein
VTVRARLVALATLLAEGGACAERSTPPPRSAGKSDGKAEVLVGPGAMESGGVVLATWLAYGVGKMAAYEKHHPPAANQSGDDFDLELAARTAMSEFWSEKREKPNRDLDRQVEIWRAGYLRELVVAIHGKPGWTIPGPTVAALRLEEFAKKFPGDYSNAVNVAIKPAGGKKFPDAPGADFPDPHRLPVAPSTCRVAVDERRAAWARWERLAPLLGGDPISASSTLDFGRQLIALKGDAQGTPHSVTWVSERVGYLAMLDGFCAVEVKDWPLAIKMLSRAVALDPSNPDPHLELSGALAMAGQLKEALRDADRALALAHDGCSVGRAWRKRGYILIEMEAFDAAKIAYEKSLEVDPGNPIAMSELATIAKALKQPGNWRVKPQPGQPPFDPVKVTSCREGKPADK